MIVGDIIAIIKEQTRDTDADTWTAADVYQYVNEAVKNTIQRAPQANSTKAHITTSEGVEQELPAGAVELINVIANSDGTDVLASVHKVDVVDKDAYSPNWRQTTADNTTIEWMKRSEPTKFLVWPPIDDAGKLYIEYSFYPTDVTGSSDTIGVSNDYLEPVRTWCLYRTFSRDSEDTPSMKRAEGYRVEFEAFFATE